MLSNPGSLSKPWVIITKVTNPANHYYVTHSIIYVTTTHRSELTAISTVVAVCIQRSLSQTATCGPIIQLTFLERCLLYRGRLQCLLLCQCYLGPGRLAVLERCLPYTVSILDRFHCSAVPIQEKDPYIWQYLHITFVKATKMMTSIC